MDCAATSTLTRAAQLPTVLETTGFARDSTVLFTICCESCQQNRRGGSPSFSQSWFLLTIQPPPPSIAQLAIHHFIYFLVESLICLSSFTWAGLQQRMESPVLETIWLDTCSGCKQLTDPQQPDWNGLPTRGCQHHFEESHN